MAGLRNGEPVLRFRAHWTCSTELEPAWDGLLETGWRITVEGDAPLDVDVRFRVPIERMAEYSPGFTAHRAVNAVAVVCAAEPGIRTSTDLPQIFPTLA